MVGRQGILRILEASIAVLIIFVVIISFAMLRRQTTEKDLSEMIAPLLEEVAKNNTLREEIISAPSNASESILKLLEARIKEPNLNYSVRICGISDVCGPIRQPEGISGNLYAGSRVISSSLLGGAGSKRVSIFLWYKS